ncbi:hypothetical protein G9P44_001145 [Scheffersomyces stipitis]|nr:hypothetical protein G9P44_001145 [Scheffersomyces stipitis]
MARSRESCRRSCRHHGICELGRDNELIVEGDELRIDWLFERSQDVTFKTKKNFPGKVSAWELRKVPGITSTIDDQANWKEIGTKEREERF